MDCGMKIYIDFLKASSTVPDLSCISDTLPPIFSGNETLSQTYFGTPDYWENNEPELTIESPLSIVDKALLERIRRDFRSKYPFMPKFLSENR